MELGKRGREEGRGGAAWGRSVQEMRGLGARRRGEWGWCDSERLSSAGELNWNSNALPRYLERCFGEVG